MEQAKRIANVIYNLRDQYTGEIFSTTITTTMPDGTPIVDAFVDNVLIFANKNDFGGGYSIRNFTGEINAKWFGAKGDGASDDTAPIQKAIDTAFNIGKKQVLIPSGRYRITKTLNLTTDNVFSHFGISIVGEGYFYSTILLGETGIYPVIDNSGSQFVQLKNFKIVSNGSAANRSKIGILQAAGVVTGQCHNCRMSSVAVVLQDDPTANSGIGSIALINFGSENGQYEGLYLWGNMAMLMTSQTVVGGKFGASNFVITSRYVDLMGIHSCGANSFFGDQTFVGLSSRSAVMGMLNTNSAAFPNLYIGRDSVIGGSNFTAVEMYGGNQTITMVGTTESCTTFLKNRGSLSNARIDVRAHNDVGGITYFDLTTEGLNSPEGVISESNITVFGVSEADTAFVALRQNDAIPTTSSLKNVLAKFSQISLIKAVPPKHVVRQCDGVQIQAIDGTLIINSNSQKLELKTKNLGTTPGTVGTSIARVLLPRMIASQLNNFQLSTKIDGLFGAGGQGANSSSTQRGIGYIAAVFSKSGIYTSGSTTYQDGGKVNSNTSDINIASYTYGSSAASDVLSITCGVTTNGDATGESVSFQGEVEIRYSNNYFEAPVLLPF